MHAVIQGDTVQIFRESEMWVSSSEFWTCEALALTTKEKGTMAHSIDDAEAFTV